MDLNRLNAYISTDHAQIPWQSVKDEVQSVTSNMKIQANRESMTIHTYEILQKTLIIACSTLTDGDDMPDVAELEVTTEVFRALRNSCAQCQQNQQLIADLDFFPLLITTVDSLVQKYHKDQSENVLVCLRCEIQLLANATSGSIKNQQILWHSITRLLNDLVSVKDPKLMGYICALLHGCISPAHCNDIVPPRCHIVTPILAALQSDQAQWPLLLLEKCLSYKSFDIVSVYSTLDNEHRLLLLEVFENQLKKSLHTCVAPEHISYLATEFCTCASCIRQMATEQTQGVYVTVRLLEVICEASSSDTYSMLKDKSKLLSTVIDVLEDVYKASDDPESVFRKVGKASTPATFTPAHGFKASLIQLIANLVHTHTHNQNLVLEKGGVELILNHTSIDQNNPFIGQWSVFAIHNLCEGNMAIQAVVAGTKMEGVANRQQILTDFGVDATVNDTGKIVIQSKPTDT